MENPFSLLELLENEEPLTLEFAEKFIRPFYLSNWHTGKFQSAFLEVKDLINAELVSTLLGYRNWRSKSTGAMFAAVCGMVELQGNIENVLLARGGSTYLGSTCCEALASFSSESSIECLHKYLDFDLQPSHGWHSQQSAMAALSYIGSQKKEDLTARHMSAWIAFSKANPNSDLSARIQGLSERIDQMAELSQRLG